MAVSMGKRGLLYGLLFMCTVLPSIMAHTYTVGDASGWKGGVDYTSWASGKTFRAGDKLVFKYDAQFHNVYEVSEQDYNTCTAKNPISRDTGGKTRIRLTTPGTRYFICGVEGHCSGGGMKIAITVTDGNDNDNNRQKPTFPDPDPNFDKPLAPMSPPSDDGDGMVNSSSGRAFSSSLVLVFVTSVAPLLFLL